MALLGRRAGVNGRNLYIAHGVQITHQVITLEDKTKMLAPQTGQLVGRHAVGFFARHLITAARGIV